MEPAEWLVKYEQELEKQSVENKKVTILFKYVCCLVIEINFSLPGI